MKLYTSFDIIGPPMMVGTIQPHFRGNIGGGIRFLCPIKADPEPIYEWYRVSISLLKFELIIFE